MNKGALKGVRLADFRNYKQADIAIDNRLVVVAGKNGAGKTNLLEAISLFSAGSSGMRRARLTELRYQTTSSLTPWAVRLMIEHPLGESVVATGLDPEKLRLGIERRIVQLNDTPVRSQSALAEVMSVLWLTPQMGNLFIEGPSGRRRFLDRLVVAIDRDHSRRLYRYEYAIKERARLLREGRYDPHWLASLEDMMATEGVALSASRREVVQLLHHYLKQLPPIFPQARLSIEGAVEQWLDQMPAVEVEDRLRAAFNRGRVVDGQTGGTEYGPHRSDIKVVDYTSQMPSGLCSTGQQKALLISLILASASLQADRSMGVPILLLDDVVAHLDEERRHGLLKIVSSLGIQTWLSGTDIKDFGNLKSSAQTIYVENGAIYPK